MVATITHFRPKGIDFWQSVGKLETNTPSLQVSASALYPEHGGPIRRAFIISKEQTLDKAAVFIDGGYLEKIMRQLGAPKIDFEAFSNALCVGTERF